MQIDISTLLAKCERKVNYKLTSIIILNACQNFPLLLNYILNLFACCSISIILYKQNMSEKIFLLIQVMYE